MTPTVNELLSALPPYRDEWVVITEEQGIDDIIDEILQAHRIFAPAYDKISSFFIDGSNQEITNRIYKFCKDNLHYREESEAEQSTMTPAGILIHGSDKTGGIDCKHYAGFIGGILDSLNRHGKKIDWRYRFASYRLFDKNPHHVFIVVKNGGGDGDSETWIDPTPLSQSLQPYWYTDKKIHVKSSDMALSRNIAGIGEGAVADSATGYQSIEIPSGASLYWMNGQWQMSIPHKIFGVTIGQTDVISTGLSVIQNITSLFAPTNPNNLAAQKIFAMFPLPQPVTAQAVQNTLNAIIAHENNDLGLDSQWIAAFADIKRQYTNILTQLQAGLPAPAVVVPPPGSPAFTALPTTTNVPLTNSLLPTASSSTGKLLLYGGIAVAAFLILKPKRRAS